MRLAFAGPASTGKTTCAEYLVKNYGGLKLAFGDQVKFVAFQMGWDGKKDDRGRWYLQELGKLGRAYDAECWIKALGLNPYAEQNVYVDDCRFPNEAEYLKDRGFKLIRLRPRGGWNLLESWRQDTSETALDNYAFHGFVDSPKGNVPAMLQNLENILEGLGVK